jgi:hypothetical protein
MADETYIRDLANQIRSKFSKSEIPDKGLDELFDAYAVLALSKGKEVTNEDVHDAWSAWATKFDPDNKSLVPFNELPSEIQNYDTKFTKAIQEVSLKLLC